MNIVSKPALRVLNHPVQFVMNTLRGFFRNQGLLLAGAIAYYALLSVVPLMILAVIALSRLVDQAELLRTLDRYLEWLVPSQSRAVLADVSGFLDNGIAIGAVLLLTMLFFSSLAFGVLEKAMSVILVHRQSVEKRHRLVYGSLSTAVVAMLSMEIIAMLLLFGAQVIAEYEQLDQD